MAMRVAALAGLASSALRCAVLLPVVCLQCRRGFRPRGRLTFFAGAKKVSQESTLKPTRRALVGVDTGRCAPVGGAHSLARQALDIATGETAADPRPTHWTRRHQSGARKARGGLASLQPRWRCPALQTVPRRCARYPALLASTASAAKREGPLAAECRHSGARASWPTPRCGGASGHVERLLRETQLATGRSVATGVYANHRTPRFIQGAFLAYFLCTSKESESAAGPKPPPALHAHRRQKNRAALGTVRTPRIDQKVRSHAPRLQQPRPTP
jgi:hypothetical protein